MAYVILRIDNNVVHARISGLMSFADQQGLREEGAKIIKKHGRVRLLVTLENFQGGEKGADWGRGFLISQSTDIEKIAIVGDIRWRDEAFAFVGKDIRITQIEFFPASAAQEAENWICS